MEIKKKTRLLTIGSAPTHRFGRPWREAPYLKISGKWFRDAGFNSGDIVEVDVKNGCLTIQKTNHKWVQIFSDQFMVNEDGVPLKSI